MKAILIDGYGGPEVLYLGDAAMPVPTADEVLVRVMAVGVNPADFKWRNGMFARFIPLTFPHIPGYDIAGIVEAAPAAARVARGARVAVMLDSLRQGAYAEYAVASAANIAVLPDGMAFAQAVAVPTPGLTGMQLANEYLAVQPGQTVLLTGATGAVGRVALWAAKRRGARVIAAVRACYRAEADGLGADMVLTLGEEDWTGGRIDCVGDTVGGDVVAALCRHVPANGRIFTVATTPIPADGLAVQPVFFPVHPDGAQLAALLQAVARGDVTMPVAQTMILADAAQAQSLVEAGRSGGKIVLIPQQIQKRGSQPY
jgi:NADPH:quinone reductase-like Zn-dependent oxidoreductase